MNLRPITKKKTPEDEELATIRRQIAGEEAETRIREKNAAQTLIARAAELLRKFRPITALLPEARELGVYDQMMKMAIEAEARMRLNSMGGEDDVADPYAFLDN